MENAVHVNEFLGYVPAIRFPQPSESRRRRVVVTGIGIVGPSGIGTGPFWSLLMSGRSAIRRIESFDVSGHPVQIGAEVPGFDPCDFMTRQRARSTGRFCQLAMAATHLAVRDAVLPGEALATPRAGYFLGTSAGAILLGEREMTAFNRRGVRGIRRTASFSFSPHSAAANSATDFGIVGPVSTICSDCPSGLDAIVAGCQQIRLGLVDAVIAGGSDAPIAPMLFGAFARSGVLATTNDAPQASSRPFDRARSGFVLGEAAVMVVLEDAGRAAARGAHVYGEILGTGCGRDRPTYIGDTDPSGQGFAVAAQQALADAGLGEADIEHVNAHAPGVPMTDLAEIRGLKALFRQCRRGPAVTSIKGAFGQPLAASGAMQLASALLSFEYGAIPPTVNCDDLDVECDLDVVRHVPRHVRPGTALVTSHGIGGNTTSVVLGAEDIGLC